MSPVWPFPHQPPNNRRRRPRHPDAHFVEYEPLVSLRATVILFIGIVAAGGAALGATVSGCTLIEVLGWASATFAATIGFLRGVVQ